MVITPTIWSTAACTIHTATIAMIKDHWTWSRRRQRRRDGGCWRRAGIPPLIRPPSAFQVTPRLNLRADYTYTVAKDDTTDEELLRRPKNKGSISAAWTATNRLTLST